MLILLCLLTISLAHGEGFIAGTLVKTPEGYTPIEKLKVDDVVISFDLQGACVERRVTHTQQKHAGGFFIVTVNGQAITVADDHKFYLAPEKDWILADELKAGHVLLKNCFEPVVVEHVKAVALKDVAYNIAVEEFQNFCISHEDILVHNVIPLIVWGAGGIAFAGWDAIGAATVYTVGALAATWAVNRAMRKMGAKGGVDYDYDDIIQNMTRKDARKIAGEKGWKEVNDAPIDSHGQPVFKDGTRYVSPDVDGHKGGRWKVFDKHGNREGTYSDDDLKDRVGD